MENDRRIRRTESAIHAAFLDLLFEKDITKITVKELCERADINKSTFYLHYRDIYDLAEHYKQELATKICNIVLEYEIADLIPKAQEIWERVLSLYLDDHTTPFSLHNTAFNFMTETISNQVLDAVLQKLYASVTDHDEEKLYRYRIFTTFIISGFWGILRSFDTEDLIRNKAFVTISNGLENGLQLG